MKVLFALSDDKATENIVKEYQKEYKEIISYKNVYYFNAILKEIQKDKSYDRIVISEDLEPFASNNYDSIDKFIFEKLDNISDEATNGSGDDTDIILIATDRRAQGDNMLVKFFGIGVYSALVGQDRSVENVCELIKKPRTKKEAKQYYKIDSDDVSYQTENENDVSETEIQNILNHYKKLGRNTDKYVDSFNNIVSQYTDPQLRVIINFLPVSVKAVLEEQSPKYQELVLGGAVKKQSKQPKNVSTSYTPPKIDKVVKVKPKSVDTNPDEIKIDMLENRINSSRMTKPVVIPSEVNSTPVRESIEQSSSQAEETISPFDLLENDMEEEKVVEDVNPVEPPKKGRGRPRKNPVPQENEEPKRGRGRPKKVQPQEEEKTVTEEPVNLFGLEQEAEAETQAEIEEPTNAIMGQSYTQTVNISSLLTRDKKIVSFVGTTKNGTSFIVNNLAELFSSMGISTAILDMTQNRDAYYIYTKNDENLRNVADACINNLRSNIPQGIKANKNLTVYTAIPGTNQNIEDVENILATLVQNYSLVLIDCDFNTPLGYFKNSQEIYLVQSMDVLTIQPLTAFLRDLKTKDILEPQKLKIVINKEQKVSGLSPKVVIGGMAFYNDPAMTFMTELFDRNQIKHCTIPFEVQNYANYLEALVNCNITLKGYTKLFNARLKELANIVYPLIGKQYGSVSFSNNTKDTLNKMKTKF